MSSGVVVTGGAGFLGSHLCDLLVARGERVTAIDDLSTGRLANVEHLMASGNFELVVADVCGDLPDRLRFDRIYHLACPASPVQYQKDPVKTIKTCVQGTLRVLELAGRLGARVLLASTSEVYGDPQVHPQPESYWGHVNPIGPRACYDEGKRCAEALAVSYANGTGIEIRIARIFNTYGPRMAEDDGRVVSSFISQCRRGGPLTVFGDGAQTRSFCYVSDLVDGLVRLMESREPGPINLGNPEETTIGELAQLICRLTGSRSRIEQRPLPTDDPARRCPDITLAIERLGWRPQVSLSAGLALTIDDWRARVG